MNRGKITEAEKLYVESIKLLKKFQLKNGAILASFPKSRYHYIYPRDHSICILALMEIGENELAKKDLNFVLKAQKETEVFLKE